MFKKFVPSFEESTKSESSDWISRLKENEKLNKGKMNYSEIDIHLTYTYHNNNDFKKIRINIFRYLIENGFYDFSRLVETSLLFKIRIKDFNKSNEIKNIENSLSGLFGENKLEYYFTITEKSINTSRYTNEGSLQKELNQLNSSNK